MGQILRASLLLALLFGSGAAAQDDGLCRKLFGCHREHEVERIDCPKCSKAKIPSNDASCSRCANDAEICRHCGLPRPPSSSKPSAPNRTERAEPLPTVRVLLLAGQSKVTLECKGAVDVTTPKAGPPLLSAPKLVPTEVQLSEGKFATGGSVVDADWITFTPRAAEASIKIGSRSYAGCLHLVKKDKGFHVVNEVDLERYVLGVVGPEIGSGAPVEAMKAQAVAARSYAVAEMGGLKTGENRPAFDVYDDTRSQVYVGVPSTNSNVEKAVEATSGVLVMYRGSVVKTYFSSSCGGATQGVREWTGGEEIPPLSGVPCGFCDGAPNGSWTKKTTLAEVSQKLKSRTGEKSIVRIEVKELSPSGRPALIVLEMATGSRVQVTGKEFRDALDLKTGRFRILPEGDAVTIEGTGYGHGVGLCQYGSIGMAQKKSSLFTDILGHYFPQAEIVVMYGAMKGKRYR